MVSRVTKYHLVYPHQLFQELLSFDKDTHFLVIEDPLFFGDKQHIDSFHQQKIVLHRASMKAFADLLKRKGFQVTYVEYSTYPDPDYVVTIIKNKGTAISVYDPIDTRLKKRLGKAFAAFKEFTVLESPQFLTSTAIIKKFFRGKQKFLMHSFYIFQRKRLAVLIDDNKPVGGTWSFDAENRKKLPKDITVPKPVHFKKDTYVQEAITYTKRFFGGNPGCADEFNYPINHRQAQRLLDDFLKNRLALFGTYEDAIVEKELVLFHSMLSAPLNIGLISPIMIINKAVAMQNNVPIACLEGFIRQIIGWREFMRAVYVLRGSAIRSKNFLKHVQKLPSSWYNGTTGIIPIDATIKKVLMHAYCHHIERLMVLGNFMLLAAIDPDDVYQWFMAMFIDAYDWVMVPNVYAMSQFADGGTITTKPYFSAANYILKMSDYKKGEWCQVWDDLFYRFLAKHRTLIAANPRLKVLLRNLDRRTEEKSRSVVKREAKRA